MRAQPLKAEAASFHLLSLLDPPDPSGPPPNQSMTVLSDRTDPVKVDNYTFQCSMYIVAHVKDFLDEES